MVRGIYNTPHAIHKGRREQGDVTMKLTANQENLLNAINVGEAVIVLTSSYTDLAHNADNLRVTRSSVQAIKGLEAKGLVKASHFWRGATVTRIA